ncbi:MAG TPA: S8 family serine peptidase, partial [Bacillota bacterium]|nr:S8 family serine peptidase [Bacillota bacterium]
REIGLISALEVVLPVGALPELAQAREVVKVWDNSTVRIFPGQTGNCHETKLIGHSGYTGKGVVVALLDTGVYPHTDLTTPENRILAWHDLIRGENIPYDDHGHGTYMAGIIAGSGRASRGKFKGLAPESRLVGIKVLDQKGQGKLSDLILGIEWCLDNQRTLKIKVISLALGTAAQGRYYQDLLCQATTLAIKRGIVVCTAAGNGSVDWQDYNSPGINPRVIKVGLLERQKVFTKADERLTEAGLKRGEEVVVTPDLLIPGISLTSLKAGEGYCQQTNYSPAAALAAGGVALILQRWPYYKPAQVSRVLTENADDLGLGTPLQGAGLMNLAKVLKHPALHINSSGAAQTADQPTVTTNPFHFFLKKLAETKKQVTNLEPDNPEPFSKTDWTEGLFAQSGNGANPNQQIIKKLVTFFLQNYETLFTQAKAPASISESNRTVEPMNLLIKTGLNLLAQEHPDPEQLWEELSEFLLAALKGRTATGKAENS